MALTMASGEVLGHSQLLLLLLLNMVINVALSENVSRKRYTIKIKLKLRK